MDYNRSDIVADRYDAGVRLTTHSGLLPWDFQKGNRELNTPANYNPEQEYPAIVVGHPNGGVNTRALIRPV